MVLYYVLEWRDDFESFSPLYITSNKKKAVAWWSMNTDESLDYFIVKKEQQYDDVFLKCNLEDSFRKSNYFAGLWQYAKSIDHEVFGDKYCIPIMGKDEPEIIDLDELQKDDNPYGIKYLG